MNIPKAIETLTPLTKPKVLYNNSDIKDAIQLGIEALKAVERYRSLIVIDKGRLLPGETKD